MRRGRKYETRLAAAARKNTDVSRWRVSVRVANTVYLSGLAGPPVRHRQDSLCDQLTGTQPNSGIGTENTENLRTSDGDMDVRLPRRYYTTNRENRSNQYDFVAISPWGIITSRVCLDWLTPIGVVVAGLVLMWVLPLGVAYLSKLGPIWWAQFKSK